MEMTKLQQDFSILRDHCVELRQSYNTYTNLFNKDNESLLTKVAPTFFSDIAVIMQRDWILQVCKIMDKAEMRGKENITIDLINKQLSSQSLSSSEIDNISEELTKYGSKLKPARNKRLAHFDRESQLNGVVLGETTETELNDFLVNIQAYCDSVGDSIGAGPLDFIGSGCAGDVLDLLRYLREKN